jgi:hypothetical protein
MVLVKKIKSKLGLIFGIGLGFLKLESIFSFEDFLSKLEPWFFNLRGFGTVRIHFLLNLF